MRFACCLATERGVDVGGSVHDALFYTAPENSWEDVDAAMKQCMDEACQVILGDEYVLKSDRDVVLYERTPPLRFGAQGAPWSLATRRWAEDVEQD
jgi:hypothetical protein